MRSNALWCSELGKLCCLLLLALALVLAAASCGGNGGAGSSLVDSGNQFAGRDGSNERTTGVLVTEEEIAGLPAWQQEMLSDPGWNQPFIAPREGTEVAAPTNELLREEMQKALERGSTIAPRGLETASAGKGVSWNDQGSFDGVSNVGKGEYENTAPGATPPWGCNNSPANSANGHAVEDIIVNTNMVIPQRISYVLEGLSDTNYFNTTGGAGSDAQSAVYQLFSTDRGADPKDVESEAEFGELSYRSDLAPAVGDGGDCSAAEAFSVAGVMWQRFNAVTNALPNLNETPLYNILIAPSGEVSGAEVSSKSTTGRWQPFYFGTVSPCYGGGSIVSLESSSSACADFNAFFDDPSNQFFFTNPVYGVIMKRWADSQLTGMAGPWESEFGFPVFGPTVFGNGSQFLSVLGTYYVFGMWFEGGFIWWIDFDQNLYPGTPDEAQAYRYTGTHTYCGDGEYVQIGTPVFYGGTGDLGVSVVVDSYRLSGGDPWIPVSLSDDNTYYTIPLPSEDGLATVNVAAHAHGYGGTPNEDCLYKYYVWAWRDGSITAAGNEYDPAQQYRTHTYGSLARNMENIYVIRVQVTDAAFDLGVSLTENRAYGDALPLHLGHGAAGGGGEILVVRNDGGNYDTNFDALIADLDEIGAQYQVRDFSATVAADFLAEAFKVAIWYRGGPGNGSETAPYNTPWSASEETNLFNIVSNGGSGAGVLLMSQSHGTNNPFNSPGFNSWWSDTQGWTLLGAGGTSLTFPDQEGQNDGFYYPFFPILANPAIVKPNGVHAGGEFNTYSVNSAERHDTNGGSGKVPITFTFDNQRQCTVQASALNIPGANPQFTGGIAYPGTFGIGQLSYGCASAPGLGGPGRYYSFGSSWSGVEVSLSNAGGPGSMSRGELLQNMLSWLDETLTFGGGGGAAFGEYTGPPEIVQVTPISWAGIGGDITPGATSLTGVHYPDPTGTDVYRGGANAGNENYIRRSAGPNETGLNANDVDFQFPGRYMYVHDPDDSLRTFSGAGPGGSNLTGDETIVGWGGLLVDQGNHSGFGGAAGTQWKRVNNTNPAYTNYNTNRNGIGGTDWQDVLGVTLFFPFAGYWTTTDEIIDTNADNLDDVADSKVTASYGTQPSQLVFSSVEEPLTFEAVAHWDHDDANIQDQIFWSMYPGHTCFDVNTGLLYGEDVTWQNWVRDTDIDPTHPNPGALLYNRNNWRFLQHGFTYSELLGEGRIIDEFDYASQLGWVGDIDKDDNRGESVDDKFPVRARLITNIGTYDDWWNNFAPGPGPNPYPNHWPDGSTFEEGGCYIVDQAELGFGTAPDIVPIETPVSDSPGYTIRWAGTYPAAPSWNMTVRFTLEDGPTLPTQVSLDLNADLPVSAANFDQDLLLGDFMPGTYAQFVSFNSAAVSGGWSNGDLNVLGIRATNVQGEDHASYTLPIWLGDVIRYDSFENLEVSQNIGPPPNTPNPALNSVFWMGVSNVSNPNRIAAITGSGTAIPTAAPRGLQSFPNNFWTVRRGNLTTQQSRTVARAQRTQAGGGPNRPHWIEHSNMGNRAIYIDNTSAGPFTYDVNCFVPIFPPQSIVPSNDDIFVHVRAASSTEAGFDYLAFTTPIWNSLAGNNFGLAFAYGITGSFPVSTVRSNNLSQMSNAAAWQWKSATNQVRPGMLLYSDPIISVIPGGVMVDNLLSTHASTFPPYL